MQRNPRVIPLHPPASRDGGDQCPAQEDGALPRFEVDGWEPSLLERMRRASRGKSLKNKQS